MSDSPISLSSLMTPTKTVEFDFPDYEGFKVKLCFLAREEMIKLRKECTSTKFDRSIKQPIDYFDEEKFMKKYCEAAIKGWSGFKFKYLEELLLVDVGTLDPDDCLPYDQENAIELLKNSEVFDRWVTTMQTDLANFTKTK